MAEGTSGTAINNVINGNVNIDTILKPNTKINAMIEIEGIQIVNDSAIYTTGKGFTVESWGSDHNTAIIRLGEGENAPQVYVTKVSLDGIIEGITEGNVNARTAAKIVTTKDSVMQYQQIETLGDKAFTVSYIASLSAGTDIGKINSIFNPKEGETALPLTSILKPNTNISAMIDFADGIQIINNTKGITYDREKGFIGADWSNSQNNTAIITQAFGNETPQNVKFYLNNVNVWDTKNNTFADTIVPTDKSVMYTYWDVGNSKFADDNSRNTVAIYIDQTGFSLGGKFSENNFVVNCNILDTLADKGGIDTFFGIATITNAENSSNAMVTFSNGTWLAQNGATFIIDKEITADDLQEFANAQGLELLTDMSGFNLGALNGKELTYIPGDTETALGYILSLQDDDTKKAGIDLKVIDVEGQENYNGYTTSSGILLAIDSEFNLSLNKNNSIILKANNNLSASYSLPEGWTSATGENFENVTLRKGDYITAATLLKNAGVTEITGKDIVWRGEQYEELTIAIEMTEKDTSESYDDYGGKYYFSLQGNGTYVDKFGDYECTALTSNYVDSENGEHGEFTILAGARVELTKNGIFISDATVYANGMIIGKVQGAGTTASQTEGSETSTDKTSGLSSKISSIFRGTFIGDQQDDGSFTGTATGFFDHYSDSTIDQVFSMATIFNVGSELSRFSKINGTSLEYDKRITGMTDNGTPTFEMASADELERYTRDSIDYEGFATELNNNNLLSEAGIEFEVVRQGNIAGVRIKGEDKIYDMAGISSEEFEKHLIEQIKAAGPQFAGLFVDMSDHNSEEYKQGVEMLQGMYGEYNASTRIGYHYEEYTYRTWYTLWIGTAEGERYIEESATYDQLMGKEKVSSENLLVGDLYSDENVYYGYMMYQKALDVCDGDSNAAMELLKKQWNFASAVWDVADANGDVIMTGRDAYYIDNLYQGEMSQFDRDYFSYDSNRYWSEDVHSVSDILTGSLNQGVVGLFRSNFYFNQDKDLFTREVDDFVNKYGGDTLVYLMEVGTDAYGSTYTNFTEYIQKRYTSHGSFDMEKMMNHFYGGDANSYQVGELSNVLTTSQFICDWYNSGYARDGLLVKASDLVAGVNVSVLEHINGTLDNAIQNALDHNFGKAWTMDAQGTIFDGTLTLFISPEKDLPSGIYSLGIRNDGAYTVVDKTIENCYGIRVNTKDGLVDRMIAVTFNSDNMGGGISTYDKINPDYVLFADDYVKVSNNIGMEGIDELFKMLGTDSPVGDISSVSEYLFGSSIKHLEINYSTGEITASGKGTRIQLNLGDAKSMSEISFNDENATHFNLMEKGTEVYGMNWTGESGRVDFDFKKGYLISDGKTFNPTSDFSATFADVASFKNYGSVIASRLGEGTSSEGIVEDSKLLSDSALQNKINSESFSCSPFNYQQVMVDMNFGVRVHVDEGGKVVDLASGGIADISADMGFTFDFTMNQVKDTGGYVASYKLVDVDGKGKRANFTASLHNGYHTVEGDDSLSARFRVGENIGLGNIMFRTGSKGVVAEHTTLDLLGTTNTFDDLVFVANKDGYLTLKDDLAFEGGITTSQGMKILNLKAGSYINFTDNGNGSQLQVLKGVSDIAAGNIKVDPVSSTGGPSNSQVPMSIYKGGNIIEVNTETGVYNYGAGTIYNWTSNTASQDFNTSVFTRQGTEYNKGAIFNGTEVIKNTQINAQGTIDFMALQHTTAEWVVGTTAAIGVVAVSAVAAFCTCGASLAAELTAASIAAVASAVLIAGPAFEHGVTLAKGFEDRNLGMIGSSLLLLGIDFLSSYSLGVSVGGLTESAFEAGEKIINSIKSIKSEGFKKTFENLTSKIGGESFKQVLVNAGVQNATLKSILSSPWAIRGMILGGNSLFDLGISGLEKLTGKNFDGTFLGDIHDLTRVFSAQGMLGLSKISDGSWLNSEVLGIRLSSLVWVAGYIIAPGAISKGIRTRIIGREIKSIEGSIKTNNLAGTELDKANQTIDSLKIARGDFGFKGFARNSGVIKESMKKGAKESVANVGQLFGQTGEGFSRKAMLEAWTSLGQNTVRMSILNVGMNATGTILKRTGLLNNISDTSPIGSLLNFIFADMGSEDNSFSLKDLAYGSNKTIYNVNLANSLMFGTIMYVAMPIVSSFAKGIKGSLTNVDGLAQKVGEEAGSLFSGVLNAPKEFFTSIWEEGFKENMVQAMVTPFVGAQAAEYISEFAFPDGDVNITNNYIQAVQNANYTTQQGANKVAASIQQRFNQSGHANVTVNVINSSDGTFGIVVNGTNGQILSRTFGSRADMQNFMMGINNAIEATKGVDFSDIKACVNFAEAVDTNIKTIIDIRSGTLVPGLREAFFTGDIRTESDFVQPVMAAASIVQQYGAVDTVGSLIKTNGSYVVDMGRVTTQIANAKTVAELNTTIQQVTTFATLSQQPGMGLGNFFTQENLQTVVEAISGLSTIENSSISQQQVNMQLARLASAFAYNGLEGTTAITENIKDSKLSDFGVTTFEQLQELNACFEIIKTSNVELAVGEEIKTVETDIKNFTKELRGLSYSEQLDMISNYREQLTADLNSARRELADAESILANAGDTMMALDSSYDALAAEIPQLQAKVEAAEEAFAQGDQIIIDYLNNQSQVVQVKAQISSLENIGYKKTAINQALDFVDNLSPTEMTFLQGIGFDFNNVGQLIGANSILDLLSAQTLLGKISSMADGSNISEIQMVRDGNVIASERLTVQDLIQTKILSVENIMDITETRVGAKLSFSILVDGIVKSYDVDFSRQTIKEMMKSDNRQMQKIAKQIVEKAKAKDITVLENSAALDIQDAKKGGSAKFGEVLDLSSKGDIDSIKQAQGETRYVFQEFAQNYWGKFDAAILKCFDGDIVKAQEFIKDSKAAKTQEGKIKWQEIRKAMEKTIGKDLTYQDRIALHLKFLELDLGITTFNVAIGDDGKVEIFEEDKISRIEFGSDGKEMFIDKNGEKMKGEITNIETLFAAEKETKVQNDKTITKGDFKGLGVLSLNQSSGKSTIDQTILVIQNHFGDISAVQAGGGKSLANYMAFGMYFDMNQSAHIAEYMGAGTNDTTQFVTSDANAVMQALLGVEVVDGSEIYNKKNESGFDAFAEITNKYNSSGRTIIAFALGDRAFVEVEAVKNGDLNKALDNVGMRVFDEADVAALSTQSFINSSGGEVVSREQVDKIKRIYDKIQSIGAVAQTDSSEDLKDLQFRYDDNSIIVSNDLRDKLKENGFDITSLAEETTIAAQVMRAMYIMKAQSQNQELITFGEDGQPGTTSGGKESPGTKDQSTSYNVALAIIAKEMGYNNVDPYKITESESSAEAIISSIARHHTAGKLALNAASSATMQDAAPIAEVIYGGKVITISSSDMKTVLSQLGIRNKNTGEYEASDVTIREFLKNINKTADFWAGEARITAASLTNKDDIVTEGVEAAYDFFKGKNNGTAGLLFGAMNMSYNAEVMIQTLARLYAENESGVIDTAKRDKFLADVNKYASKARLSETLEYISKNYRELKAYTEKMQVVDAKIANENPDYVTDVVSKNSVGRITFSNVSALRGVDYKSINMIILDGHNFTSSDLYQAIGRAGRNIKAKDGIDAWGKDKTRVAIMMEGSSIERSLKEIQTVSDYMKAHGNNLLFTDTRGQELLSKLKIKDGKISGLTAIEEIELVASYKSRQTQSSSILFKAHQEISGILGKNFIVAMISYANEKGLAEEVTQLEKIYAKVLSHSESNIFAQNSNDVSEYVDSLTRLEQSFMQEIAQAEEIFEMVKRTSKDSYIVSQAEQFLQKIEEFNSSETPFEQKRKGETIENKTFVGVNSDIVFDSENPITDLAKVLVGLSENLLPTKSSMAEMTSVITNETVQQEMQTQWAENENLVKKVGDKFYLTELGQNYAKLRENGINMNSNIVSTVLGFILQMLLGGGFQAPEDDKEFALTVARALQENGITNVDNFNNLINGVTDVEMLNKIKDISEFKNIVNATHPQGLQEFYGSRYAGKSLPNAQYIALMRFSTDENDKKIVGAYDKVVEDFYKLKARDYKLTPLEKAQNSLLVSGIGTMANIAVGISSFFLKLPVMSMFGKILPGANSSPANAMEYIGNSFNGAGSVMAADVVMPNKGNNNKGANFVEKVAGGVLTILQTADDLLGTAFFNSHVSTLDKLIKPALSDVVKQQPEEIKSAMAQIRIPITTDTDTVIANMTALGGKLSPEVRDQLFKEMSLSDISKFNNITSILSLDGIDEKLKEADYQTIADLLSLEQKGVGLSKIFDAAKGMFDKKAQRKEQLYRKYPQLREKEKEKEQDKAAKEARVKLVGVDPYSQTEGDELTLEGILTYATALKGMSDKTLEERLKTVFAVIYPTKDTEEMLNRFTGIKDRAYIKYARVSDLAKDSNFTKEGEITGAYEKELKYSIEVEVGDIKEVAKENIIDITDKVKATTQKEVKPEEVVEMLLTSCAVEAMEGVTRVLPTARLVEGLTKMAVEMVTGESEYEGIDSLKAAGEGRTASVGILKDLTGYEYALIADKGAITSSVIAYFDKNHVAQVSSKAQIEEIEKQGYKFTGLVLADKNVIANNEGMGKEIMLNRVYGVMKGEEVPDIIKYLLGVYKEGNRTEAMLDYIGATGISKEEINEAVIRKIENAVQMGAEGKAPKLIVDAQVKALTGIREVLFASLDEGKDWLDKANETEIVKKIEANKRVSQSVITKAVSGGKVNSDFVINIVKLQKAIADKDLSGKLAQMQELMKTGKTDLGALMEMNGEKELKMPMDLFNIADIYAISSAA